MIYEFSTKQYSASDNYRTFSVLKNFIDISKILSITYHTTSNYFGCPYIEINFQLFPTPVRYYDPLNDESVSLEQVFNDIVRIWKQL